MDDISIKPLNIEFVENIENNISILDNISKVIYITEPLIFVDKIDIENINNNIKCIISNICIINDLKFIKNNNIDQINFDFKNFGTDINNSNYFDIQEFYFYEGKKIFVIKLNDFNKIFEFLKKNKKFKLILIFNRYKNKKWIFNIPSQPQRGIFRHNNDSFRELPFLWKNKYKDINIVIKQNHYKYCRLFDEIILYDTPTMEWATSELLDTTLVLLGNGDIKKEGKHLTENGVNVKPWIFWARRPGIIDKKLNNEKLKDYNERISNVVFIGNFENNVQEKYRKNKDNWESVVDKYHCTAGEKHLFSQEQYLEELSLAKFGLSLRGYGRKCHREVELMAFGTVPLITKHVSITSYLDPPIENIHYIKVKNPEDLKEKVSKISEKKWKEMSKACHEWYMRNIHYTNSWESMINNLFYN
jgi:hypothetical protein